MLVSPSYVTRPTALALHIPSTSHNIQASSPTTPTQKHERQSSCPIMSAASTYASGGKTPRRVRSILHTDKSQDALGRWTFPARESHPSRSTSATRLAQGPMQPRQRTHSSPGFPGKSTAPSTCSSPSAPTTRGRSHRRSPSIVHSAATASSPHPAGLPRSRRRPRSPSPPSHFRYLSPPPPVPPIPAAVMDAVRDSACARASVVSFTARAMRVSRQMPVIVPTPPPTPPPARESPRLEPLMDERIPEIGDFYALDELEPLSPLSPSTPTQEAVLGRAIRVPILKAPARGVACAAILRMGDPTMGRFVLA